MSRLRLLKLQEVGSLGIRNSHRAAFAWGASVRALCGSGLQRHGFVLVKYTCLHVYIQGMHKLSGRPAVPLAISVCVCVCACVLSHPCLRTYL